MTRQLCVLLVGFVLPGVWAESKAAGESELPPVPVLPGEQVLQPFDYADAATAARAFKSIYGSAPAATASAGSRHVVAFPCRFVGNKLDRGCWDAPVDLDLTACRGVTLKVFCRDLSAVTGLTLYCQSGRGWYGLNFNPPEVGQWCTIELDKRTAVPEGEPAGWGRITALRFSAWRGAAEGNADVYLADLALLGADAPIVVLDPPAAWRATQPLGRMLRELDMPHFNVRPDDLRAKHLQGRTLLILPNGAKQDTSAAQQIKAYTQAGGAILTFGEASTAIPVSTTTAPALPWTGDIDAQSRTLMQVLGKAAPKLWTQAVDRATARIGEIGPFTTQAEVRKHLLQLTETHPARRVRVTAELQRADELQADALKLRSAGSFSEALPKVVEARAALVRAYCLAQSSQPKEQRMFWCHSALGVEGRTWDESIRLLAQNGFTAILPNMLWGGVAYYRSDVLPVWPELATRGDPLAECLAACKKYGVECHVWKVNWYMSGGSPRSFIDRMKREGRTQVQFDGSAKDDWLCPSHPANQRLEIDAMLEVATKYAVNGIHFDYIRYPGPESCFCSGCRERFQRHLGHPIAEWPAATRHDAQIRDRWLDWRRGNITAVVAAVSQRMRAERPGMKVSAAVFRIWPTDRDSVAQDWKLWCEKRYLDFVCPMDYTPNVSQFRAMVRTQTEWAAGVPCFPGIGLSVWPERNDICRLIDQIAVTRELATGGFTVFNYAQSEANVVLPLLGMGPTRRE